MSEMNIDLLRKDECQPLTTEQMDDIKSQFHPSNTANVNIVPYEIYDEDGEEIVVGEVRKTIDGVKKKKPVYKKVIVITNPAVNWTAQSISSVTGVDEIIKYNYTGVRSNTGARITEYYITSTDNFGVHLTTLNGDTLNYYAQSSALSKITISVYFTKTTDEWTAI